MALFEWSSIYSVGIEYFDRQHQHVFSLLNLLHDSIRKGHSRAVLAEAFEQLREYTDFHFGEEEEAMEALGYSGLDMHRLEHEKLRRDLRKHFAKYQNGEAAIGIDLLNFVLHWWTDHIQKTDKEYKNHFSINREKLPSKFRAR